MKIVNSTDIIANILYDHGIRHVVVSSGSRSLRMVKSVASHKGLTVRMVVDERVAAFSALGISDCTLLPVAIICTSGSAMLNYAPALAEAFYRGIPLIVITADRPIDVVDINDGQTIHQFHAFDNIVKHSIDIDATSKCNEADFDTINEAVSIALSSRKGPVHINLHLEEVSDEASDVSVAYNKPPITPKLLRSHFEELSISDFAYKKILIFVGQRPADNDFDARISRLASFPNVVIVTDIVSNCKSGNVISDIETIIDEIKQSPDLFAPQLLITLGKTSPLSRRFKEWLRGIDSYAHWRVNDKSAPENTYSHLSKTIVADDNSFLDYLAENLSENSDISSFCSSWHRIFNNAQNEKVSLLSSVSWSDISAVNIILNAIPDEYVIQCSNGMAIRNLSLVGAKQHLVFCNRGVNGIDGSTSTAIGFSSVSDYPTLFISGDMSALYDVAALFSGQLSPKFKMVIIANGGGEIFRMIKATRDYELREEMLCAIPQVSWRDVANAVGMEYFEVNGASELSQTINSFFKIQDNASLLVVNTSAGNSKTYNDIINKIQNKL